MDDMLKRLRTANEPMDLQDRMEVADEIERLRDAIMFYSGSCHFVLEKSDE